MTFNNRMDFLEERVSELVYNSIEIIPTENKENRVKSPLFERDFAGHRILDWQFRLVCFSSVKTLYWFL